MMTGMTFSQALGLLIGESGLIIRRCSWPIDEEMYLYKNYDVRVLRRNTTTGMAHFMNNEDLNANDWESSIATSAM